MLLSENGHKTAVPEPGVLTGVMEPGALYDREPAGEGRLEWLERKVRELDERVKRLENGKDDET